MYNLCRKHGYSGKISPDVASDQREDADTFLQKRKPINRYRQSKGDNLRIKGRNRDDSIEKKKEKKIKINKNKKRRKDDKARDLQQMQEQKNKGRKR